MSRVSQSAGRLTPRIHLVMRHIIACASAVVCEKHSRVKEPTRLETKVSLPPLEFEGRLLLGGLHVLLLPRSKPAMGKGGGRGQGKGGISGNRWFDLAGEKDKSKFSPSLVNPKGHTEGSVQCECAYAPHNPSFNFGSRAMQSPSSRRLPRSSVAAGRQPQLI